MKKMISILVIAITLSAHAQWSSDPTVNIPISDTTREGNTLNPRVASDGNGGAFIVWGAGTIYGQNLNANGNIQWNWGGIMVGSSNEPGIIASLANPVLISDDSGGVIIVWNEISRKTIGASRVRPDGTRVWDMLICYTIGLRENPVLISDGAGGAIITWQDERNGSNNVDIFAQRVSATGVVMWDSNGVAVCTATRDQTLPSIASDGDGGAFITWQDNRTTTSGIYARRINSLGVLQWQANGIPVCATSNPAAGPKIVATAPGEAVIAWTNGSSGGTWDIYAQKVNLDTTQWASNGVSICNAIRTQWHPGIIADGFGGAIISWRDTRRVSFSEEDIYAQSISSGGLAQWTQNGIPICTQPGNSTAAHSITSDGDGGAIIAWEDYRSGTTYYDIYAQRVNRGGNTLWMPDGRAVCVAPRDQRSIGIAPDGNGGAIIAWHDRRDNTYFVIYAQRVRADGSLGGTTAVNDDEFAPTEFSLEQNYPNPFNPSTRIKYAIGSRQFVSLKVYDVLGDEVTTIVNEEKPAGNYEASFDASRLSSGVYFYKLQAGSFVETKKMILIK